MMCMYCADVCSSAAPSLSAATASLGRSKSTFQYSISIQVLASSKFFVSLVMIGDSINFCAFSLEVPYVLLRYVMYLSSLI